MFIALQFCDWLMVICKVDLLLQENISPNISMAYWLNKYNFFYLVVSIDGIYIIKYEFHR